jgi:hypothetical protein
MGQIFELRGNPEGQRYRSGVATSHEYRVGVSPHTTRRAVGTHYGPARMHQARFSPRHRRDGRAGTTIIQLVSAFYDRTKAMISDFAAGAAWSMGNAAASAVAVEPFTGLRAGRSSGKPPPSCRTFPRNTGRPGAADAAVDPAGAAEPSEELRAGRIRRMAMLEYTTASGRIDHATFQERADASVRCSGF